MTTFETRRPVEGTDALLAGAPPGWSPRRSRAARIWPTISSAVRLRTSVLGAGMAKGAGERAADLARQTQCAAAFLGNVHGLDVDWPSGATGGEPKEPFSRSVLGNLLGDDLRAGNRKGLGECRAKFLGDIGHDAKIRGAAEIYPMPDLTGAHSRLTIRHAGDAKRCGKFVARQADERGLIARTRSLALRSIVAGCIDHRHSARFVHRRGAYDETTPRPRPVGSRVVIA